MMRVATCRCGALQALCSEEPVRVSVCHCSECRRRTGSAFSAQARFQAGTVEVKGTYRTFERKADSGNRVTYQFCPGCGSTIAYAIDAWPDVVAIPLGSFESGEFPDPAYSIYERQRRPWVTVAADGTEHFD